ncbi:hypothetical protein DFH29DRAFT_804597, partial [Suillus ampliporus]
LRKLTFKILHSTMILLPEWKSILEDLGLSMRIMPHNVSTHWNSTYDILNFSLNHQKAIDAMMDKRRLGLGKYELTPHEWTLVQQLHNILKDATLFFSHSMLNLAMVIPAMDHIDSVFTSTIIRKEQLDPAIYAGLRLAKHTLNHYYLLTDSSATYHIAIGMFFMFNFSVIDTLFF